MQWRKNKHLFELSLNNQRSFRCEKINHKVTKDTKETFVISVISVSLWWINNTTVHIGYKEKRCAPLYLYGEKS